MEKKWYVVYKGWVPGVYDEWDDCLKQVNKFKGNSYKGYKTREQAEARWMNHLRESEENRRKNWMKTLIVVLLTVIAVLVIYLIVV